MIDSPRMTGHRRFAVAVALLLATLPVLATSATESAAQPAAARPVRVTAGEHDKFSRVVFALGADIGYRTEPEPAGVRVVFPDTLVDFDYREVYPERRARRVMMAEPVAETHGTSLRLRFGCDCKAQTFVLGAKLVIDISDAAPSASEPSPTSSAPATSRADMPDRGATVSPQPAIPPPSAEKVEQGHPRPEFLQRVETLDVPRPRPVAPDTAPDAVSNHDGFDPEHLRRMLAWAIDQGHLTAASTGNDGPLPSPLPEEASTAATRMAPATADAAPIPALTVPPSLPQEEPPTTGGTSPCPAGSELDMAALGGAGPFEAELAHRQDALSRALAADRGVSEAQHALAGFYLARLMPHEALAALGKVNRQETVEPARAWLEAAALVLADHGSEVAADEFQESPCKDVDARVWRAAVLAAHDLAPQVLLESAAILARLAQYPPNLRVELGLRLAEAGIEASAPAVSEQFLDLVEGAAPAGEAKARLWFLRGRLAAARSDFAEARSSWQRAAGLPGEDGLRATLAVLEADLQGGELDEAAALAELDRLAYDWREHTARLDIARLTAAIHERRGHLSRALAALEELALDAAGRPNGRAAARLATDLMRRAYADTTSPLSADEMAAFWRYEGFVPTGPEGADVRLAFARALIARGLPDPAITLLEPISQSANSALADQAIDLLVEGHLAAHEPSKALDLLRVAARKAPAAKPERNLLAARALAALGRFAEAAGLLHDTSGDAAEHLQASYLWKAGLWKEAAAAYRARLADGQEQAAGDSWQAASRLAAAAYMAEQPAILAGLPDSVEGTRSSRAISAFAPLPAPVPTTHSDAARATMARLLEQAHELGELAEQYGLRKPEAL